MMSASRGPSSSSSVIAEQVRAGVAPGAIVVLGAFAAAEVYGTRLPIVLLDSAAAAASVTW